MKKLTKAERVAKKKQAKSDKAAKALANRKVVKSTLSKKQLAKKRALFSVKAYLYKKAQIRAIKLQYRAARRNGTLPQPQEQHVHTHDHDHDHEHEEEALVLHEDDLSKIE